MLVDFEQMPDDARLWVYQIERKLALQEVKLVEKKTQDFLKYWRTHGQDLKSSYKIEYDQFLIISVDESFGQPSGCSIDASVHLIHELESTLGISFMTSNQVAFLQDGQINLYPFNQLKECAKEKIIQPDTPVFDNTIQKIAEFKLRWFQESRNTWINKYF